MAQHLPHILIVGSINIDLVIRSARLPRPGETVLGGEFYRAHGGKGANQAVAASRAGQMGVTFLAAVGDDPFGEEARAQLARENISLELLKVVPEVPTGAALILVGQGGENLISVASGANWHLTRADVEAVPQSLFVAARVFLVCLETPLETVARGLSRARQAGAITILNPAPATRDIIRPELLSAIDVLTPNAEEARLLTGIDPVNGTETIRAAEELKRCGCRSVVITLGSRGCVVVDDQVTWIPGIPVEPVDTTAAGDAFNGALAVALAEGKSLHEGAAWANSAAALSVMRRGAQPSLPTRAEIDEIWQRDQLRQP